MFLQTIINIFSDAYIKVFFREHLKDKMLGHEVFDNTVFPGNRKIVFQS